MKTPLRAVRLVLVALAILAAAVAAPVAGLAGWMAYNGKISIGTRGGTVTESFTRVRRKHKGKHRKIDPWRKAPEADIYKACAASITNASEARTLIGHLQTMGAPGMLSEAEGSISVIFVPDWILALAQGGEMGGAMVVTGNRGVLLIGNSHERVGRVIYHEAIHLTQFSASEKQQEARRDSLLAFDGKRAFPSAAAFAAWNSVGLLAAWPSSQELGDEIRSSVRQAILDTQKPNNNGQTPLQAATHTVLAKMATTRYQPLRERMAEISRIRRGVAGDPGPLAWQEEVVRLMVFETEAAALDGWCAGTAPAIAR